jgi:hypothetical protein
VNVGRDVLGGAGEHGDDNRRVFRETFANGVMMVVCHRDDHMTERERHTAPTERGHRAGDYFASAVLSSCDAHVSATCRLGSSLPGMLAQPASMTNCCCWYE